jgi:hypothetical protein
VKSRVCGSGVSTAGMPGLVLVSLSTINFLLSSRQIHVMEMAMTMNVGSFIFPRTSVQLMYSTSAGHIDLRHPNRVRHM